MGSSTLGEPRAGHSDHQNLANSDDRTPAWKTKNYYSATARMEHNEGLEKKFSTDSPERDGPTEAEHAV